MEIFQKITAQYAPLAEQLRPREWVDVAGQEKITKENSYIRQAIVKNVLPSLIFWGPPGSGKTTLAQLIAEKITADFIALSAVSSGVKELREVIQKAEVNLLSGRRTILFLDEIHRWNKSQQDGILPYTERGTFILIGATTENPSFAVNSALLSRCEVVVLESLNPTALSEILQRALATTSLKLSTRGQEYLIHSSNGDARTLLNRVEILARAKKTSKPLSEKQIGEILNQKVLRYDKSGEEHYNLISALHKSLRGSDPDAALYYLARMLVSGEPPLYVIRRLVRFAAEDIGNADPSAMAVALRAKDAYDFLGSPEGELAIAQATAYLACSPKSNAIYAAWGAAERDARELGNLEVPKKLRNAPTKLMKKLDYGKDYHYAHQEAEAYVPGETYLPEKLVGKQYYHPTDRGLEKQIRERLAYWKSLKK